MSIFMVFRFSSSNTQASSCLETPSLIGYWQMNSLNSSWEIKILYQPSGKKPKNYMQTFKKCQGEASNPRFTFFRKPDYGYIPSQICKWSDCRLDIDRRHGSSGPRTYKNFPRHIKDVRREKLVVIDGCHPCRYNQNRCSKPKFWNVWGPLQQRKTVCFFYDDLERKSMYRFIRTYDELS